MEVVSAFLSKKILSLIQNQDKLSLVFLTKKKSFYHKDTCLIILSSTNSKYISPHCGLQKRKLAERSKQSPPWQSHNSWGQSDCIFKSPTVSYIYT